MNHEFYYNNIYIYGTEKLKKLYANQNRPLTRVETRLITRMVETKEVYDHEYADSFGYSLECAQAEHLYNKVCRSLTRVCKSIKRTTKVMKSAELEVFGQ